MGSMNFASASPLAKRKTTNRLIMADHPPLISGSVEEAHEPKPLRTNDLGRDYPPIKHLISGSVADNEMHNRLFFKDLRQAHPVIKPLISGSVD